MTHHLHMTFDYAYELPSTLNKHHIVNLDLTYASEDRRTEKPSTPTPTPTPQASSTKCSTLDDFLSQFCRLMDINNPDWMAQGCPLSNEIKNFFMNMVSSGSKDSPKCPLGAETKRSEAPKGHSCSSSLEDKFMSLVDEFLGRDSSSNESLRDEITDKITECLRIYRRALNTEPLPFHECNYKNIVGKLYIFLSDLDEVIHKKSYSAQSVISSIMNSLIAFFTSTKKAFQDLKQEEPGCSDHCVYRKAMQEIYVIMDGLGREHLGETCCAKDDHRESREDREDRKENSSPKESSRDEKTDKITECLRIIRRALNTDPLHECSYKNLVGKFYDFLSDLDEIIHKKSYSTQSSNSSIMNSLTSFTISVMKDLKQEQPGCSDHCVYRTAIQEIRVIIDGLGREYLGESSYKETFSKYASDFERLSKELCNSNSSEGCSAEVKVSQEPVKNETATERSQEIPTPPPPPPMPEPRRQRSEVDATPADFTKIFTDLLGGNNSNLFEGITKILGDGKKLQESLNMEEICRGLTNSKEMEGLITQFTKLLNPEGSSQEKTKTE